MTAVLWLALLPGSVALAASAGTGGDQASVHRFALIAGSNAGGDDRVPLRYADSDASGVAQVMEEVGGIAAEDTVVLLDPNRASLLAAFDSLALRIAASKNGDGRTEVLVYYSGHSDEQGLLLGTDKVDYAELRQHIYALPADVRIAILDSCASGELVRGKGGSPRPSFLVDTSTDVKGHAFLTSSSADEVAQESDSLRASFFTHYLVSGLRGAADLSGDGRVTLNEAYHFAFTQTLARTERTQGGAQHPAYDIELSGTGDLVMTDLHATSTTLDLGDELDGHLFVRDQQGDLVAELDKTAGRPAALALTAGTFTVTRDVSGQMSAARVDIAPGGHAGLAAADFHSAAVERTASRGTTPTSNAEMPRAAFTVTLFPKLSSTVDDDDKINHVAMNVIGYAGGLDGFEVALGLNTERRDARGLQLALGGNAVGGNASVQGAVGFNTTGEDTALQAAVGFNFAGGDVKGAQLAAGFNIAHSLKGLQTSTGLNYAEQMQGLQLSLLNVSGTVHGAQIGLVNIAGDVQGWQVGLVNIAGDIHGGAPIGLLNVVKHGRFGVDAWASDLEAANVGVKFGSRNVYTLAAVGAAPGQGRLYAALGFGASIPHNRWFVDIDAQWREIWNGGIHDDGSGFAQLRGMFGWRVFHQIAPFAGLSWSVQGEGNGRHAIDPLAPRLLATDGKSTLAQWPGAFVGIEL